MNKYITDQIRLKDYPSYLSSLFIPLHSRPACWAILSFNLETVMIRDSTTNIPIGRMKYQWWRESIDHIYNGKPPNHPTALALGEALQSHKLSKSWFKRILQARVSHYK